MKIIPYLILPLPILTLWLAFYIGHLLHFGEDAVRWFHPPFLITCLFALAGSIGLVMEVWGEMPSGAENKDK